MSISEKLEDFTDELHHVEDDVHKLEENLDIFGEIFNDTVISISTNFTSVFSILGDLQAQLADAIAAINAHTDTALENAITTIDTNTNTQIANAITTIDANTNTHITSAITTINTNTNTQIDNAISAINSSIDSYAKELRDVIITMGEATLCNSDGDCPKTLMGATVFLQCCKNSLGAIIDGFEGHCVVAGESCLDE